MTQRQRVLALLESNHEGVTTSEFLTAYLPSYPKRIFELRGEGYEISSERLRASSWRYTLLAKPGVEGGGEPGASKAHAPVTASSVRSSVPSPLPSPLSAQEEELFDRTIPQIGETASVSGQKEGPLP